MRKKLTDKSIWETFANFSDFVPFQCQGAKVFIRCNMTVSNCLICLIKVERFKKISWIPSHQVHHQWRFKLLVGKFTWGNKAKHGWGMWTNFLFSKVCWQRPAMLCPYSSIKLPRTKFEFFSDGEGDGIKSRLPFKIFSNLHCEPLMMSQKEEPRKYPWLTH